MINEDEDKCVALEGGAHRSWGHEDWLGWIQLHT